MDQTSIPEIVGIPPPRVPWAGPQASFIPLIDVKAVSVGTGRWIISGCQAA